MRRSSITSKVALVALVTSMYCSGIGNDSSLGTYSLTLPAISLEMVVKTCLILLEDFLVLLLGLGYPRSMFSELDLVQIT